MNDHVNEHLRKTMEETDLEIPGHKPWQEIRPRVVCGDGVDLSIQAGEYLYSTPRLDWLDHYTHVEVGFPSICPPDTWREYAEGWTEGFWGDIAHFFSRIWGILRWQLLRNTFGSRHLGWWSLRHEWAKLLHGRPLETVYPYIPIDLVNTFIEEHGGIDDVGTYQQEE